MPFAPKHPCTWPGCGTLVSSGSRCPRHTKQQRREIDERRGTAHSRGYDARWQQARRYYLANHPLCSTCKALGRITAASVVDHMRPHKGNMVLFWDERNWQPLCKACHDSKTARSDGRWG